MERFAIKIDKKLKANLYKICRLCGIDNPDMVPIISDKQSYNEDAYTDVEEELEMQEKINLLIGLSITKDDRMPQTMCCLCVDKINDFYEFREMCIATNAQTRKLLGLKNIKKSTSDMKTQLEIKDESVVPSSSLAIAANKNGNRKRKSEEFSFDEETPETSVFVSKKKSRFSMPSESFVKEESSILTKKKLRFAAANDETMISIAGSSKKVKNYGIEDTKLKNEVSPLVPVPLGISNKKLRLSASQKEPGTKKSKKSGKNAEQKGADIKDEIKEEMKEDLEPISLQSKFEYLPPAPKLKFGCSICKDRFAGKNNLEAHIRTTHIPKIERYVCTACSEVLSKSFDIKNHQLWHKLSKTPYLCGCCGETIMNTYAFSRHLREHAFETPSALLVLDRECPQCHISYATNFLYNIHICAVRTKRCAGCNRIQRNDAEYLKHSAQCAKVYLNYSKHIMPTVEALEDAVRIKNENDVEAAAEEIARISGVSVDMAPVVQLTRLSSPLIMAASQCVSMAGLDDGAGSTSKKSSKKGVSKKDLKRVDELLKSTLDALVSIKHEPEVHVDHETPSTAENTDNDDDQAGDPLIDDLDDFHNNNDSDIEREEVNESTKDVNATQFCVEMRSGQEQIKIKQEIYETCEENMNKIVGGLKLKIKKEHGQLNSSIIEQQKCSEKRGEKRKKKKKHKDREREKQKFSRDVQDEQVSQDSNTNNYNSETNKETMAVRIKAEPQDETEAAEKSMAAVLQSRPQPEATIMTSIPMMQFQIACVSSGVEFNNGNNAIIDTHQTIPQSNNDPDAEDVKPNREELDRMLKISHVSSGIRVETAERQCNDAEEIAHCGIYDQGNDHQENNQYGNIYERKSEQSNGQQETDDKIESGVHKAPEDKGNNGIMDFTMQSKSKLTFRPKDMHTISVTKSRNKACKSTARPPNLPNLQITSIQSGVALEDSGPSTSEFIPIFIKSEPQNRGYSDEQPADESIKQLQENDDLLLSHSTDEQNYISSIDFNNITIKQEKDIEINDVHISEKSIKSFAEFNGVKRKRKGALRSQCFKDKVEKDYENADEEEPDQETDEDENIDDEVYEEEEEDEEVEEEDDEDAEEEEYEEREYRELEYPPELVERKSEEVKTEEQIEKPNGSCSAKNNTQKNYEDTCDNLALVIANVCSQAKDEISDIYSSKANADDKTVVENDENNSSTKSKTSDGGVLNTRYNSEHTDNKILKFCHSADNNSEEGNYRHLLAITGTSCDGELEMESGKQKNAPTTVRSLQFEQSCEGKPGKPVKRIDSAMQLSLRSEKSDKLKNQGIDSEFERSTGQVNRQNMLHHSVESTHIDQEYRVEKRHDYVPHSQKLLENLPNIQNLEQNPQTSQHGRSVKKQILKESSELYNIGSIRKISKDNQKEDIEGFVQYPKDVELEAQPITRNIVSESDNDTENPEDDNADEAENELEEEDTKGERLLGNNIEERQNDQNQEMLTQIRPTAFALHPYLEDISSSSNSLLSNSLSQTPPPPLLRPASSTPCVDDFNIHRQEQQRLLNIEETENILNESNDVLSRRSLEGAEASAVLVGQPLPQSNFGQHLPDHMPTFNFDNINEIAENNNNANIEREQLQDGQQRQHQQN